MCRSIKTLRTEPEWNEQDVRGAALQYVRKLSGYRKPSRANAEVFEHAVDAITEATTRMLLELSTPNTPDTSDHLSVTSATS